MVQEERAAETLAAVVGHQGARSPGSPWVEGARDERVVDRAELAAVVAAWRGQGLAGRH